MILNDTLRSLMHPIEIDPNMRTELMSGGTDAGGRHVVVARSIVALHQALLDRVEWCGRVAQQETA